MTLPERLPGLRLATVLLALYGAVWIALEGSLPGVLTMGVGGTAVSLGHAVQRLWGGRTLARGRWLLLATGSGALLGLGAVAVTFVFMAVKTGLHSHGPEFTPAEMAWLWGQLPLWLPLGTLTGLGLGMLDSALGHNHL